MPPTSAILNAQKIRASFYTHGRRKPRGNHLLPTDTESRLRPFRRRLARTLRPLRVAMRARKPCVRLRLIECGWYVRFTMDSDVVLAGQNDPLCRFRCVDRHELKGEFRGEWASRKHRKRTRQGEDR